MMIYTGTLQDSFGICPSSKIYVDEDKGAAGPSKEVLARTYANIRAVQVLK
jgi:hypothetical protein